MSREKLLAAIVIALNLLLFAPIPASQAVSSRAITCTITGTKGPDLLRGTPGRDVICGGRGRDTLLGLGGDDVLRGGYGADVVKGGGGDDVLYGFAGRDTLFGGPGGDDLYDIDGAIDGGSGTDYCPWDGASLTSCESAVPTLSEMLMADVPTEMELAGTTRSFMIRVHLRDPLGVTAVDVWLGRQSQEDNAGVHTRLSLGSGSARDGWWVGDLSVPGHQPAGSYLWSFDVLGRFSGPSGRFEVPAELINSASDFAPPVLSATSGIPSGAQVSISESPQLDLVISDDLAGVRSVVVQWFNTSTHEVVFVSAVQVDGSPMDGVWRATLADPSAVGLGAAEFAVTVTDNAGNRQGYWGPWLMDWLDPISDLMRPIPDGAGPFDIVS